MIPREKTRSLLALALLMAGLGCSTRNIHRDLGPNPQVMVRQWTMRTHGPFEAGDRGTEYSSPILVDNTLIFGSRSVGLVSLYPALNQVRWALPIDNGVISPLTVEGSSVYVGAADGYLYSVDVETGRVNWRFLVRNALISKPTVAKKRVFVTTADDTVYCLDAGSGEWIWHYRRRSATSASIHAASSPLVDGDDVLVGLSDGFLVSLSVNDGKLKWERKLHRGSKFTDVDAHPVRDRDVLYVPSYDGSLYALRRSDGQTLWRYDAGGAQKVTIEGNRIFLPSSDGHVYALDKTSGKVLWKFELDDGVPTELVVTDRYVAFGSSYQYLYLLDKESGQGAYRFNAGYGSGFDGSPAYDPVHKRLYLLSGAGNLYAFMIRDPLRYRPGGRTDGYVGSNRLIEQRQGR